MNPRDWTEGWRGHVDGAGRNLRKNLQLVNKSLRSEEGNGKAFRVYNLTTLAVIGMMG